MDNILKYVGDVNILLVVLDILFLTVSFLYFNKKGYSERVKDLFVVGYTLINLFLFTYFNSIFQGLFTFKYLSIKIYLIIVVVSLIIFLYSFNRRIRLFYKIFNYLLGIFNSVILLVNIYIVINNKLDMVDVISIDNSIKLMNISCIVFFLYLVFIFLVYIGYYIYDLVLVRKNSKLVEELDNDKVKVRKKRNYKIKLRKKNNGKEKDKEEVYKRENDCKDNSLERLLEYKVGDTFYINGIDCSIIFCDSNKENIVKNYDILSKDITAKLVNGYTLEENIMIRSICDKLNINNLGSVDINNFSILNLITVDEYVFLKNVINDN